MKRETTVHPHSHNTSTRTRRFYLQQIRDNSFGVSDGSLDVFVDEHRPKAPIDELADEKAVITAHGLEPFGVEVVVLVGLGPEEARVPPQCTDVM